MSYGIYIFHMLLLPIITQITRWLASGRSTMTFNAVQFVVAAVLSLACSTLSFHLFESQFLRLKKYFIPRPKTNVTSSGS